MTPAFRMTPATKVYKQVVDSSYHDLLEVLTTMKKLLPDVPLNDLPITCDMFKHANPKAMQTILYSLILLLDKKKSSVLPWPLLNRTEVHKFCAGVITFIKEDCAEFPAPKLLNSLISSASGDKFVQFLLNFCMYMIRKVIQKRWGTSVLAKPAADSTGCTQLILDCCKETLEKDDVNSEQHVTFLKDAKQFAKELLEELDNLQNAINIENEKLHSGDQANTCEVDKLVTEERMLKEQCDSMLHKLEKIKKLSDIRNKSTQIGLDGMDVAAPLRSSYLKKVLGTTCEELQCGGPLHLDKFLNAGYSIVKLHNDTVKAIAPSSNSATIYNELDFKISAMKKDVDKYRDMEKKLEHNIMEKEKRIQQLTEKMEEEVGEQAAAITSLCIL